MNILPYVAAYFAISLPLCLFIVFLGYRAKTPAKPADPVMDDLKARLRKAKRNHLATLCIVSEMQAVTHARLEHARLLDNARLAGGR